MKRSIPLALPKVPWDPKRVRHANHMVKWALIRLRIGRVEGGEPRLQGNECDLSSRMRTPGSGGP